MVSLTPVKQKNSLLFFSSPEGENQFRTARHQALFNTHLERRKTSVIDEQPYVPNAMEANQSPLKRVPLCENNDILNFKMHIRRFSEVCESPYLEDSSLVLRKNTSSPVKSSQPANLESLVPSLRRSTSSQNLFTIFNRETSPSISIPRVVKAEHSI